MLRQRSEQKGRKALADTHGTGLPQVGQLTRRGAAGCATIRCERNLQVAERKNEAARKPNTGATFRFHGFPRLPVQLPKSARLGVPELLHNPLQLFL